MSDKAINSLVLLLALWAVVLVYVLYRRFGFFIKKKIKVDYMCGYHLGSFNRKGQLSLLSSTKCYVCDLEASNVIK